MTQASETAGATASRVAPISAISLPSQARGLIVGTTGSGKSELGSWLMRDWARRYPQTGRILILDSKPRFRAERELSGLSAKWRYRKWRRGPVVRGSVRIPVEHAETVRDIRKQLDGAWRLGATIAIAQGGLREDRMRLRAAADAFYTSAEGEREQLLYVDEFSDYFGSMAATTMGDSLLRIIRSGREMGVAFLAGVQRPRGIPLSAITECTNLYVFDLANPEDWDHLAEMGLPATAGLPDSEHAFYFYSKKGRREGVYKLRLTNG